jgi:hypothetical protein
MRLLGSLGDVQARLDRLRSGLHAVPEESGHYSVLSDMSRSRFRSDLIA